MRRTKDMKSQLLKAVMTLLVMCVMFVGSSLTSLAAEGKITTSSAKIRKEANTSCDVVGSAVYGETYDIVNEVTGSDGYVWYQISYEEDKLGYVRSDLMQKTGSTTTTTPSTTASEVTELQPVNCTVTGGQVNIRSNASTSGNKVAQVRAGEVMTINGQATDSENKTWYRVTFTSDNGDVTGFVRYDFVSVSGDLVPVTEEEPPQEVTPPVVEPPVTQAPEVVVPSLSKDYETVEDGGVWYLIDNLEGNRYNLESVMDAAVRNPQIYAEMEDKVKSQKGWIVFLVILVIFMGIAVTLLVLKVKDVMDEAYFSAVEKETIRQRQSQRQNSGSVNKNVMHTVGSGSGASNTARQGSVPKASVPKMNVERTGSAPQTVKVSNPADTRPKPVQQRPAGERPVSAKPKAPVAKPTVSAETKVMPPVTKQESKKAVDSSKQTWQSKNFMTDEEDDDFEYGFLDWDEGEE